jgi:CubicO group peptidase (beta-lactamase class C family)
LHKSVQSSGRIGQSHYNFNVPGIAVAIIKDGKVVLAEGYGVKSIVQKKGRCKHSFGIASNSKALQL